MFSGQSPNEGGINARSVTLRTRREAQGPQGLEGDGFRNIA
jgi:hypothetical protein